MTYPATPAFAEWMAAASQARRGDPIWSVRAYRLALYAIDCHGCDRQTNAAFPKAPEFDQLSRAIGSTAANIAEGYSKSSIADRNRFYEYALGSAREAIAWYDAVRFELGAHTDDRQATLIQVRRLLLTMLRTSRTDEMRSSISDPTRKPSAKEP
jgi:four helix bundle protein